MKKINFILFTTIALSSTLSQTSVIRVIDKRTWDNPKTSKNEKFPIGFFAGIELNGKRLHKPVMPNNQEETELGSKTNPIDAIYIYEPEVSGNKKAQGIRGSFKKLPLKERQPGVLVGGGVLEVSGNLSKGEVTYTYYRKNSPSKKQTLSPSLIKVWQAAAPE